MVSVHDDLVCQRMYHVVQTVTTHVVTVNINLITACSLFNVLDPCLHPLWVSDPPNPRQTLTRTFQVPLPMERVRVCIG